jgi:two-component system, NtrC family, response regulator AtoC
MLAKFFLDEFTKENKLPSITISVQAKEKLMKYSFPGNVRELKAVIELSAVMSDGKEIQEDDITFTSGKSDDFFLQEEKTLRGYTIQILQFYLKKYEGNVLKIADKLDIGKSTIYKMIQNNELVV